MVVVDIHFRLITTDGFKEFGLRRKTLQVTCLSFREQLVDYVADTSVSVQHLAKHNILQSLFLISLQWLSFCWKGFNYHLENVPGTS